MKNLYQYKESGLDNIYLTNGFTYHEGSRGRTVSIENREELHCAIGHFLATQRKHLDGREARFLRHEMGLSQSNLALLLGKEEQSIARWEKKRLADHEAIPPDSERMIRLLYLDHSVGNPDVREFLQAIADLEKLEDLSVSFKPTSAGWEAAA